MNMRNQKSIYEYLARQSVNEQGAFQDNGPTQFRDAMDEVKTHGDWNVPAIERHPTARPETGNGRVRNFTEITRFGHSPGGMHPGVWRVFCRVFH